MNPYRTHHDIGTSVTRPLERLRRRPDMVGKVRRTIREVVRVEEWKGIYQSSSDGNRDEEGFDRVPGSIIAIFREIVSERVFDIEIWRLGCTITLSGPS